MVAIPLTLFHLLIVDEGKAKLTRARSRDDGFVRVHEMRVFLAGLLDIVQMAMGRNFSRVVSMLCRGFF